MREPQTRRTRLIVAGLLASLVLTAAAAPVLAGKGRTTTSASLAGPVMVLDVEANGTVNHLDAITFDVASSASSPYVGVRCYQGSAFVYDAYVGYFASAWFSKYFTLDSTYWNASADASCTARLFYYDRRGNEKVQATLAFDVSH